MTIEECYLELGGSYTDVTTRLPSEAMVKRFVVRFLDDPSYAALCREMAGGNREQAFRAAHTLKGVCANLGFARLQTSADALTEVLRSQSDTIPAEAAALLEEVRGDYQITTNAIRKFRDEQ